MVDFPPRIRLWWNEPPLLSVVMMDLGIPTPEGGREYGSTTTDHSADLNVDIDGKIIVENFWGELADGYPRLTSKVERAELLFSGRHSQNE